MPSTPAALRLDSLFTGRPGLTENEGGHLAECAAICLNEIRENIDFEYRVEGFRTTVFQLVSLPVTEQMRRTFRDLEEATEYGACAISILTMESCEGLTVHERSPKDGGGFDYYLVPQNAIMNREETVNFFSPATARLEVSGILRGGRKQVEARMNEKRERMMRHVNPLAGYIIVIEFSNTYALMEKI